MRSRESFLHLGLIWAAFIIQFWGYYHYVTNAGGHGWWGAYTIPHHPVPLDILWENFTENLLWYYHAQSPLYTWYSVLLTRLSPPDGFWAYYVLHTVLGAWALYCIYRLSVALGANARLATLFCILFVLEPSFYIFQSQAWNDYATMCLVSIAAWRAWLLLTAPGTRTAFWFFMALAVLGSVRTVFHPLLFVLPVFLLAFWYLRASRKSVALGFALPFLLLLLPYVRTLVMFGYFGLGAGQFAVAVKATAYERHMTYADRVEGIEKGRFSFMVLCFRTFGGEPFQYKGQVYDEAYCAEQTKKLADSRLKERFTPEQLERYARVPILSDAIVPPEMETLFTNLNSLQGIVLAEQLIQDSMHAIADYPHIYQWGIACSLWEYFRPSATYPFAIARNVRKLPTGMAFAWPYWLPFAEAYEYDYSQFPDNASPYLSIGAFTLLAYAAAKALAPRKTGRITRRAFLLSLLWIILAGSIFTLPFAQMNRAMLFAASALFLAALAWMTIRWMCERERPDAAGVMAGFMLLTILFCSAFAIMIPVSEQNRYRIAVDGLYLVLLITAFSEFLVWCRTRAHRHLKLK